MSLKDWEETGGKPQASPEKPPGTPESPPPWREPEGGPRFYRQPYWDPITRRRLVELMAVILIIFSVMYVMIPVFIGTAETSRRAVCARHVRHLLQAAKIDEMDSDGLPPTPAW